VAPRFLIDENLSPELARHLSDHHGYDAVHVNDCDLAGRTDEEVMAHAVAEVRVVVTANAEDFRRLARARPGHPGLAILLAAGGRVRQIANGLKLATVIEEAMASGTGPGGYAYEVDRSGSVRRYPLPDPSAGKR
jgi:predicted nuclease of predicted toxin-antitoxin system